MHGICGIAGKRCCMRICSDKSAAAEQDASEITCYNNAYIGKSALFQDFKYRHTACTLRLAIIGITGDVILPENICVDVMLCFTVLGFDRVYKIDRFIVGSDRSDMSYKLGTFFDE